MMIVQNGRENRFNCQGWKTVLIHFGRLFPTNGPVKHRGNTDAGTVNPNILKKKLQMIFQYRYTVCLCSLCLNVTGNLFQIKKSSGVKLTVIMVR